MFESTYEFEKILQYQRERIISIMSEVNSEKKRTKQSLLSTIVPIKRRRRE